MMETDEEQSEGGFRMGLSILEQLKALKNPFYFQKL